MFDGIFRSWHSRIAIAGAVLVGPLAVAGTPAGFDGTTSAVRSLHLQGNELGPGTLGNIRGGFELTPNISINFGFSQIDSLGKTIIQSIIVPVTTLTESRNNATAEVSGSGGSTTTQLQALGGVSSPSPPVTTTVGTTDNSTTTLQSSPSTLSLTSTANQGQTTFLTQLAGSGITNIVQNQANNQLIQQVTTITIGISGMSQWLSEQRGNMRIGNGFSAP